MSKSYDLIILGGGIGGASIAYEFSRSRLSTLVIDSSQKASGGSSAAGAFISPKISKPSFYKEYINTAFNYTTKLYNEHFSQAFKPCGLEKYPLDEDDLKKLESYEEYIDDLRYEKRDGYYFFQDAGIAKPNLIITQMLKYSDLRENYHCKSIRYDERDECWRVDDFCAKYLIIATATLPKEFEFEYINTKQIGGYRYDVEFDGMEKLHSYRHKDLSISSSIDGKIKIGATFVKNFQNLSNDALSDRYRLIDRAKSFYPMPNLEILQRYSGVRVSTYDYLPIVGKLIDAKRTLQKYPSIKKGTKIPTSSYIYHNNLFIHTALSSRGFVTAPYNAKLLSNLILNHKQIDDRLSPVRLFTKFARKES